MKKLLLIFAFIAIIVNSLSAQISVFPHFSNFEAEATCGTTCPGNCNPIGDWKNADQWGFPQAGMDWLTDIGGTPSTATGPDIDHTLGNAAGKYLYTESSGCFNVTAHLVSAIYDFSALSAPRITFWYHMFGATMGTMHLDVDTTGLGNWVLDVVPSWTNNQDLWLMKDVSLALYAGRPSIRLRIRGITGSSFTSDMAVDDITVYEPPANDIKCNSVSVQSGGCAASPTTPVIITLINVGSSSIPAGTHLPVGFDIGGVTVLDTAVANPAIAPGDTLIYVFTNGYADLSGPTAVLITVWSAWLLDTGLGNDTASGSFIGTPLISDFPYYQDFESGQNGWRINNITNGTWAFGTPAKTVINSAASGINAFVTGGLGGDYLNGDISNVQGPCFDFTNICDPVLSLNVWWNAEFSWDGANVTISTDGGNTWTLVGVFGDPLTWYTDNTIGGNPGGFQSGWSGRNSNGSGGWVNARHRLVGAGNMPDVKIRINFGTDGSIIDDGFAFDDINIFNGTELGQDQTICSPDSVLLNAYHGNPSATYLWSTGSTGATIYASSTAWYSVDIDAGGGCIVTDSMYLFVMDSSDIVDLGPDASSCASGVVLDAGFRPGCTYSWSGGETTHMITALTSGIYFVAVTTPCGDLNDTIVVTINPLPIVDLGSDTVQCGGSILLDAGSFASFNWSNGDVTQTSSVSASGLYSVVVTDTNSCQSNDTVGVTINPLPIVNLGPDSAQCGGSIVLDAGSFVFYFWSNGDTTQMSTVSVSDDYSVEVEDINGCLGYDTVAIAINTLPVASLNLPFSFVCISSGTISLIGGYPFGGVYSGPGVSGMVFDPAVAGNGTHQIMYHFTDTNGCSDTASQWVIVDPCTGLHEIFAGGNLLVYPNPSTGIFNLEISGLIADPIEIFVTDLQGRLVWNEPLSNNSTVLNSKVDLSNLDNGIYFLTASSGSESVSIKIIINR